MKRRIVSVLTALALVLSLCPTWAFATEADTTLCKHHRSHTEACGYVAPIEGQPCSHEHGDECYSEETVCCHNHDELCYSDGLLPAEGEEKVANACTHTCSAESGCITRTLDCQHVHDEECGYVEADPGTPCGHECRTCPLEALIDALPNKVTEENRADVEAQLQEILALFAELPEDQQELVDITPCLTLQEQLDAASAASPLADEITLNSRITINSGNLNQYNNKVITGSTTAHHLTIDGVEVSLTIKDLSLLLDHSDTDTNLMHAGIALRNNATLHLTLEGTNKIKGGNGFAAISVPEGCTLEITSASTGSLEANGGSGGAGIGADWGHTVSSIQTLGSIEINGGNISARGNLGAAGIGGNYSCTTGSITITGGTVYAEGSSFEDRGVTYGGAGIGGGYYGYVPTVNITGGTVTAKADCNTAACIGAGTDGHFLTGDNVEYRCGNISITGGTVTTDGNIALGHSLNNAAGSITLSTGATLNINNGAVRPMPTGWNSYSMNGRVFDTSITGGQIAAGLLIDGRIYDVTIEQDTSQPYCGDFSLKLLLPEASSIEAGLLLDGKTLTETVPLSSTTVNVTFGTQDYQKYSITGTIYDGRITGDMEAAVAFSDETHTVTLKKTSDYCATFCIDNLVAAAADVARELPVTVTAGGITWNGTASGGAKKTLAIGRQLYKTHLIFWDGGITANMSVSQIQVSRNGAALDAAGVGSDNTLHMTQVGRGYVDIWMVPGEDTSISVTVPGLNGGQTIQKTGITIESNNNNEFEMYRGVSADTPTLDVANGNVIFEETDGSLSVKYYEGGEQKTSAGLSYDALHAVTQSNNTSAVANRIIVRNIKKPLYLQIEGVNLNREGQNYGSPISIEANCTVELQTKGSNTVVSNSVDPAVYVAPSATLTLSGDGELTAKYTRNDKNCAAAIGGKYNESSGKIIIRSGKVATKTVSSSGGAGIGGGENCGGDVEIHGGTVEANATNGAGIGGGISGTGTVKIYGGTVTVTNNFSGTYGAGIGGGRDGTGTVDIYGGNVNVVSNFNNSRGAGIGGGESGSGTVRIYGGNVNVVSTNNTGAGIGGGYNSPGTVEISGGTVTAKSSGTDCYGAAIGGGEKADGKVTISGGKVSAVVESSAAAIGGGRGSTITVQGGGADIKISGGVINASAGYGPAIGSGGGSGVSSKDAVVTISGGTITTSCTQNSSSNTEIGARSNGAATVTITGGSIRTQGTNSISSPTNGSETVSLVTITLPSGAVPADMSLTSAEGYGVHDVYPLDGNKFYFYLPANTLPASITAGGVDYVPESAGSTNYVVDFQVSFLGYSLTKEYDGTPMQKPTTDQVTSNGVNLTFAWYQGETPIIAPVNAGSYTLRVSSDKGSKDFGVEITKRPLTIAAQAQTIDYGGSIEKGAYTSSGLAAGDTLNVTLTASQTAPGTYSGAITISSAAVMRSSTDVTGNYEITSTPGGLTINKIAPTVNSWPTAGAVTYGQTLGDSTLAGGSASTAGSFSWKNDTVKPGAGTAEYDVIFTPTDTNYKAVTGKVSVNVQKAALTVTANNQTIAYGGSIQTGVGQVTAAPVNGDELTEVQVSVSADAGDVGTYTGAITVTGAKIGNNGTDVTANYEISYGAGDLTISPLTITVTPDSGQSKEYGADDPVLTYTVTPALIGDDKLTGALTRAVGDNVGDYEIIQGTLAAGNNYALTVTSGVKFAITKPSLENAVVTLDNASFTYDGTAKTPAVTVTKGGAAVAANEYDISYSNSNGGAGNHTNAGTVTVTVTARADGNYSGFNSTATFTIAPKELTPKITGAATKTYDGGTTCDGRGLSITLDGLLDADTGNVTATASYVYADKNVGTDKTINASGITLDGASKDNYVLSKTTATANVGMIIRATVNIIWGSESQTMTYNGTQATITEPTVSAESGVTVSVSPKYSYAAQDSTDFKDGLPINAGTYTVRASIAESDNLTAAQADTTLTINKAALTVSGATIKSKSYDTTKTATVSGVTFTGLKNGEMLALGTDYTATGTFADANVGEGKSVTVTVTLADTAKANNYNLTPNTTMATADITKADPVVTDVSVSSPDPIYESASLDSITLTHGAGDTAGTVALDPSQTLTVGTKGYAWTFTPTDTDNYNTATGTISLTVAVDALQSIAVTTPPTKTTYTYGESFDKAGMVITAIYASGATKVVTGEVQISPAELTVTTTELTITYQGKTVTQAITVGPKEVTNPTIELSPTTFVYDGAEKKPAVTVKDGEKVIPADEYTVEYSNNTNVGTTATVTITDKTGGNYTVSGTTTFTITAKPLTGAKVETTGTFTYTGNALTPAPTVTLDGKTLTADTDYTVAYTDNTNAGTAKITVTGKGNYSGTAQGTFIIGRADLTVDGTGTASGTYGAKLSELAVSGLTAKLGATEISGTWKLTGDTVPNVEDSGEYTATFTPATGAGNYNALTAKVTLNIAKATAPAPQTGTLNVQNGHAREYTYDLSRLLPVLASGQSFGGEVTYALKTVNITEAGYYDSDTAVISGTTLTLPVKAVESTTESSIGTITVTISSKNFADVDATINVNRVNKQPVSIEGVTAQNGTYNGSTHNGYTGTPTASPYSGGFTTTYATADGTALSGPPTNAGDYTVTFSLDPNDTYTGSRTLSFTVAKASITITADDKQADVGTAKPALTYTVTGLVSGDTLATEPTLTCDADMNTIGQYPITASGAAVPSGGNYNTAITYVPGTLNVTDPTIPVTGVTLNKTSTTLTVGGSERLTATVTPSDATDKSVTWASSNTAVATADANGTVTAVSAGTATITVTTADGAKTATCTVTVRTNSSGGGGGGGGGGTTTSPTVTVPVSGDKGTVHVSASVSGTTATVSKIDTSQIENVIGDNGQASMVEIDFTGLGKTIDTVKLPAAAIKDIAAKAQNEEVRGLTVKLPEAEISFDANALSAIQAQASNQITLTVTPAKPADLNSRQKEAVGSAPVFDLTLRSSSGAITDFRGGYATVSLPYTLAAGQNPSGVVVYYLDSTGNITPCTTMYDVRSKSAIFTTGHLSLYFVGYDPAAVWVNPFSDVAGDAWYYDAVRYASENGLMGGYGNGMFGPNDNLSRAQFAQILFNKEGRPVVNYLLRYNDVADGAWYTEAVRWATSQGVVSGYGNGMFGPNDNITREQLAVMLWRYAGSPAATDTELHFTDTDKASGYALEALRWAVENGIINGYGNGRLGPQGQATRAQVAQILKNFLDNQK